jgi:hypothetical protein
VIEEAVPDPKGVDVPALVIAVIRRALEKDPAKRFQTAREMEQALSEYLLETRELVNTTRIAETMAGLFQDEIKKGPTLDRGPAVVEQLRAGAPDSRGRSFRGAGGLAVAAAAVAALGLGGWLVTSSGSPSAGANGSRPGGEAPIAGTAPPESLAVPDTEARADAGAEAEVASAEPDAGAEREDEDDEDRRRKRRRARTKGGFVADPDF